MKRDKRWLDCLASFGVEPDPFVDEVSVDAVAHRDVRNGGTWFGTLLNNLEFEGFTVGTALRVHEESA